jgi:tetratricopeptide (TPR) repeat protein
LKATREHQLYPLALSALCAFALWLRWANFTWMHIDERVFVERTLGFWGGDFNPHFFNYPTLQLYLASLFQYLYFQLFATVSIESFIAYAYFADDQAALAVARALTTLMAVATVPVVAAIGYRLYGMSGGLIAGFLLCILPLHVRYSHLATTDAPAALWMSLALLFAVGMVQEGRLRDYVLAGICAGLAATSKYPAALVGASVVAAALWAHPAKRRRGLLLVIGCALLSFVLTTPYVLLDFPGFWQDFAGMANEHLLNRNEFAAARPPALAGLFALPTHLYYGAGLAFSLVLLAALAYRPKDWRRDELVVLIALLLFLLLLALSSSTFMRYALPIAPLIAVVCARILARQKFYIALAGLALASAEPLYTSWHLHRALAGPDTRTETAAFLAQETPQGSMVLAAPSVGGRARLLSLDSVQGRQRAFSKSFSDEELTRAYKLLSQRDDLPPLYIQWGSQHLLSQMAPPHVAATDSTWLLWYEHPLTPHGPDAAALRPLLERASWRAEFSPGDIREARFDGTDWYFAPIGSGHKARATGPSIRLARLPLLHPAPAVPSARQFFSLLYRLRRSAQAVAERDWPQLIDYNTSLLKQADYLRTLTAPHTLFQLCYDLASAWYAQGETKRAAHYWNQAILLDPQSIATHYWLGRAYQDLKDYDKAQTHYHRAQAINPLYSDVSQRLRSIDTKP